MFDEISYVELYILCILDLTNGMFLVQDLN